MILYGYLTEESIGKLFLAGVIPGLIVVLGLSVFVFLYSKRKKLEPDIQSPIETKNIWPAFLKALPVLFAPVIILGGIYSGIFTPNESAAVAALYCMIITMFVYRTVTLKSLIEIFYEAAATSATIMFVVSGAMLFSYTGDLN